jgi:2-dehydro-3-deoxyphosphogluconate aldolase/(4S)-4-hydroxy-2-oxoglutarate aldolase
MNKNQTLKKLLDNGVIAVIRIKDWKKIKPAVDAIRLGGIKCIEITMTVPGAIEIIREYASMNSTNLIVGAGTVTDQETSKLVIDAGAKFVVSPILNPDIIAYCKERDVVCISGCYTPTEIFNAWNLGADIIKVFPAQGLTPRYFKDLSGPFPQIKLIPTGGVTIENVGEWVAAGAVAVGIGSELLDKKAIEEGQFEVLTKNAQTLMDNFRQARERI